MTPVTRIFPLTLLLFCGTMSASVGQEDHATPTLVLSEPWFQLGTIEHMWKYRIELHDVPKGTRTTFVLSLRLPERTEIHATDTNDATLTSRRRSPFTDISITATDSTIMTLEVVGRASDVKVGPRVRHEWRLGTDGERQQVSAAAPEEVYDPSLMRFVFGSGLSLRQDDHIDFVVDEGVLRIENDSRLRLATTVGALFKVSEFGNGRPIDILLSLDFSQEPRRMLDGFMFGVAFGISKYLSLGGGYELRVGRELSPGFRQTSAELVKELLDKEEYRGVYARFSDLVDPEFEDLRRYDWFPLEDPREQRQVTFGAPLTKSHNHGWFLGVFIPVDFKRLFSVRDGP